LPYQLSVMSLFEQYGMGIPILVPTVEFLWELHNKYVSPNAHGNGSAPESAVPFFAATR
jgi:hypothetical protein